MTVKTNGQPQDYWAAITRPGAITTVPGDTDITDGSCGMNWNGKKNKNNNNLETLQFKLSVRFVFNRYLKIRDRLLYSDMCLGCV